MTTPQDFEPNFGDKDMPPGSPLQEKTPGVYIRADEHELPHELDMLWSPSRPLNREERSPVLAFIAGLASGAVLTSAVFLLLITHPFVKTEENNAALGGSAVKPTIATPEKEATVYTVVNGDTLGRIAGKVYGSTHPRLVEKIQQANHMASPHALQINQKLIIPPREG